MLLLQITTNPGICTAESVEQSVNNDLVNSQTTSPNTADEDSKVVGKDGKSRRRSSGKATKKHHRPAECTRSYDCPDSSYDQNGEIVHKDEDDNEKPVDVVCVEKEHEEEQEGGERGGEVEEQVQEGGGGEKDDEDDHNDNGQECIDCPDGKEPVDEEEEYTDKDDDNDDANDVKTKTGGKCVFPCAVPKIHPSG